MFENRNHIIGDVYKVVIEKGRKKWQRRKIAYRAHKLQVGVIKYIHILAMASTQKDTSLITILSSTHGKLRREQRDIDKRDLRKALKHGVIRRTWGDRRAIEYDGIIFITDASMRREITAFPSPLPEAPIDNTMQESDAKAKALLERKPELVTSHTVLVIDDSGSMLGKKDGIHLYRDCQQAAFSITSLEFVAEQLFNGTAVNSDLLSLVKFSSTATTEFSHEPISWRVYNALLSHRSQKRYLSRLVLPSLDNELGESNYLPALESAHELLRKFSLEKCALSLFFFSDGVPTDHSTNDISYEAAEDLICDKVTAMSREFGEAFTVSVVGIGNRTDSFSILKSMAEAATYGGAKGSFEFCGRTANSLNTAVSSLVSSTTTTITALKKGHRSKLTTRENLKAEKDAIAKFAWQWFEIVEHFVYDRYLKRGKENDFLPLAAVQANPELARIRTKAGQPNPPFLAINRNYLGKGAERVAFRCRLSDSERADGFVFHTLVAKETKDVERMEEKIGFHVEFMETQLLANHLAYQFNMKLRGLPHYQAGVTPQVSFLECSVLQLKDPEWHGGLRGVLVEQKLDTDRFRWTKWNDNDGMVNGVYKHMPLDVDFELKQLRAEDKAAALAEIAEDDEDESSDDDSDNESVFSNFKEDSDETGGPAESDTDPSDYLQAFTHFTYRYTYGKVMVCDLQGIFNTDMTPPTFQLTDPAIHYASYKGRRMVYGRTDKGRSGHYNFFKTHKCTSICKYLELSAKNKKWKRDWLQNDSNKKS
jgi:hypothetical protein